MSIMARLRELSERHTNAEALLFIEEDGVEKSFTWGELDTRSTQIARGLANDGAAHGDRVGIKIRNSPDHILVALATYKIGAIPVPIRWDLPEWELTRVLDVLDARLVIEPDSSCLIDTLHARTEPLPDVTSPNASGIMSSGSTGSPKVILRLIPGLFVQGTSSNRLIEAYSPLKNQLIVVPAPLYHNNGFMAIGNLIGGDRLLLMERFNANQLLAAIEDHSVTGMTATTVMLQRLAADADFDERDLSSLEWVMHGAAPLPDWLAKLWIGRLGADRFFVCYGSSEGAGATFARGDEYLAHPGTVGKGAMGTELKILDDEAQEIPNGEIGHIYMKSEHGILSTYIGDVEPIPVTDDGYATVGDLGWLDDDGYLYLADRRVDMIISGGANVYPAEVEAAISEHPAVADVVVIGLPDPDWGRRVHAIVHPSDGSHPSAEDLTAYASSRLARYKVPKTFEFIEEIPRSEATKVNRAALIAEREGMA